MSGIAGIVNFKEIVPQDGSIELMIKKIAHRGQDALAIWHNQHIHLGHVRQVVIDKEGGAQPLARGHVTVVLDGRIYNAKKLTSILQSKGYTFTTRSHVEVVLNAYLEWQEKCVDYLDGMFAIAISDEKEQQLHLFRDRLGVKPLFYVWNEQQLLFASEIKALLTHNDVAPIVSYEGLRALLSIGPSRIPGTTVYSLIKEVEPAQRMVFSLDGVNATYYWDTTERNHIHDVQETKEQLHILMTDAIEEQLDGDVKIASLLSGGLDSSIITAVTANKLQEQLHTYSVDYEDNTKFFTSNNFQTTTDHYWISLVSEQCQTAHHEVIIKQDQLVSSLARALVAKDYPSMVDIDSSLLLFGEEIKKDYAVILSGEGADELFGGYPWFHKETPYFPWIRSIDEREQLLNSEWQRKLQLKHYLQETYTKEIGAVAHLSPKQRLFHLNKRYFMQTLLERKDRMTQAASIEARLPFTNHHLAEYVWNIPFDMKALDGMEKGILRKSFEGVLPNEVLYRKKNPYPKTYHPKYTELVRQNLTQRLGNKESIIHKLFDKSKITALIETGGTSFKVPWFGQLMAGPQLLAFLIQLDMWFIQYEIQLES